MLGHCNDIVGQEPAIFRLLLRCTRIARLQLTEKHEESRSIVAFLRVEDQIITERRETARLGPEQREQPIVHRVSELAAWLRAQRRRQTVELQHERLPALVQRHDAARALRGGLLETD